MTVHSAASLSPADTRQPLGARLIRDNEWVLLAVILVECIVFGLAGHNFATSGNAFEITRLSVEVGLLALALTPIIVTGGIDLSVGSMMGLAAVALGFLWHDVGLPLPVAVGATLMIGIAGGALTIEDASRLLNAVKESWPESLITHQVRSRLVRALNLRRLCPSLFPERIQETRW